MKIIYQVWYRDYANGKKLKPIGEIVDYWKGVDFSRARKIATEIFGRSLNDPHAIVVTRRG